MGVTYYPKGVVQAVNQYFPELAPGLGCGVGELLFLVPNKTTDLYYQRLIHNRVRDDRIFTTLATAYAATTANQGDTVCAFPGAYTPSAELAWANSQTHLIGLGGSNQRHSPAAGTTGMVRFYCTTTSITSLINVTGDYCNMANFQTRNTYDSALNVCDLKITGKNFYGRGLALRGGGGASQIATDAGVPLYINTSASGYSNCAIFEYCYIGDPFGTARTGGETILCEGTTGQGACIEFRNSRIMTTSETAGVSAIKLAGNYSIDRYMLLENTLVYNFSVNLGNILTQAITDSQGTTHMIILSGSTTQYGWGKWCNSGTYVFSALPQGNAAGGKAVTITG